MMCRVCEFDVLVRKCMSLVRRTKLKGCWQELRKCQKVDQRKNAIKVLNLQMLFTVIFSYLTI